MTTRTAGPARFLAFFAWAGPLAVAWAMCLLPLQARAQPVREPPPGTPIEGGCSFGSTYVPGGGAVAFDQQFVPAILNLKRDAGVGDIVYSALLPEIPWACGRPGTRFARYTPDIVTRRDYVKIASALDAASLGLRLVLNVGTWNVVANSSGLAFGSVWRDADDQMRIAVQNGVLSGRLELYITRPIDRPLSVSIPLGPGLFRIGPGGTFASSDVISIGSTLASTQVFMIPGTCLVKVAVPSTVDLGIVYSVGNLPLPAPRNFNVNVALNPDCEGFGDPINWRGFILPFKIRFSTPDAAAGDTAISLRNSDGGPNGLNLALKQSGALPVAFNSTVDYPTSLTSGSRSVMDLPYTAQVVKNGAPLVTGKFSQQVVVNVTYF